MTWRAWAALGLVTVLITGMGVWSLRLIDAGRAAERGKAAEDAARDYRDGRKDADDAKDDLPDDDGAIVEWLRGFAGE